MHRPPPPTMGGRVHPSAPETRVIRRVLLLAGLLLTSVVSARAQDALAPALIASPDPATLRHALVELATRASVADSVVAAEAWALTGQSYHRAGKADSAISSWQRSIEIRAASGAMDALIDGLYERRGTDDVAAGRALVMRRFQMLLLDAGEFDQANTQGRLSWGLFLSGRADSAKKSFARSRRLLDQGNPMAWVWRRRIAVTAQAAGDQELALEMCKDLVVRSMLQDQEALRLLHDVLGGSQADERYAPFLRAEVVHAQRADIEQLAAIHARRVALSGIDGFPVSTVLFDTPRPARRAVIAIATSTEEYARFDSLAAALGRAGWALAVMDARGSGGSLARECPSPESWSGREETMESATAGDVRRAFSAVAHEAKLDSTAYVVLGSIGTASIAVEAAVLDRRVRALVLLSPMPPRVELGRMAARLERGRVPTFIETAPADVGAADVGAALYGFVDPKLSRLVDSESTGRGPMVFRFDGTAGPRLTSWLLERFPPKTATRPAPPR